MHDVVHQPAAAPDVSAATPAPELRGSVLDVVRALLAENDLDAVLEIVGKLASASRTFKAGFGVAGQGRLGDLLAATVDGA